MKALSPEQVARICHEANRAYCLALGDDSQPHWEDAPDWQKASAVEGVKMVWSGKSFNSEQTHNCWLEQKLRDGWTYGAVKDPQKKTHPCLLPYEALSDEQKMKDTLFFGLAMGLSGLMRDRIAQKIAELGASHAVHSRTVVP